MPPASRRCLSWLPLLVLLLGILTAAACSDEAGAPPDAGQPTAAPSTSAETPAPPAPLPERAATPPVAASATAPPAPTLTLLGHSDLGGRGFNGNVRALGQYAYVGSWGSGRCPALGVRVVDLADPASPRVVATAARFPGTSAEDVVPLHVDTPAFTGDLLAAGIQRCSGGNASPAGLALVDVTDPRNPRDLGFFSTGPGVRGVHELDVTVQNGRVLALLAVPYSARGDGDFRIVDITDPRNPTQLASWDARDQPGLSDGTGCTHTVYDHSAHASPDGTRALLAYWDAGAIILDISDPSAPRYLGRAFEPDVEGAIHSVDVTPDGLLLVTEEDDVFRTPRGLRTRVAAGGVAIEARGCEADGDVELDRTGVIEGTLAYPGDGCATAPAPIAAAVVLVESGGCGLTAKAEQARAAGARALILIQPGDAATPRYDGGDPGLPLIGVSAEDGARLRDLAVGGAARITLPSARPWGGVRVWDISNPANPVRRALFRTENADRFPPPGPGYYTVHNPLSAGRYALFSWYADGVRVVDLADADHPREVASFVPPDAPDPQGFFPTSALVWGVARAGDLVLASDINSGLWVLRAAGLP